MRLTVLALAAIKLLQTASATSKTVQVEGIAQLINPKFLSITLDASELFHGFGSQFQYQNKVVVGLAKTLGPSWLRVGGTDADFLWYQGFASEGEDGPAYTAVQLGHAVQPVNVSSFDALANFAKEVGWKLVFGLSELNRTSDGTPGGKWNPSNAEGLIRHAKENQQVVGWELGNEMDQSTKHNKTTFDMDPQTVAKDFIALAGVLSDIYGPGKINNDSYDAPSIVGCDVAGSLDYLEQFAESLAKSGKGDILGALTWHHYYENGHTSHAYQFIEPKVLDKVRSGIDQVQQIKAKYLPNVEPILGESSSAYDGGTYGVSDRFASTFWWLDQLGYASYKGHKAVIRQTFTGGAYELVTPEAVPNPDYYTAVLWKRLVGQAVLGVKDQEQAEQYIRTYAYCGSRMDGTVVLTTMNLLNSTAEVTATGFNPGSVRNEYLLQGLDGVYTSPNMTLNGHVLALSASGEVPAMPPASGDVSKPIELPPLSAMLVEYPEAGLIWCKI